jgi:hypothetical protein
MAAVAREAGAAYEWINKKVEIPAITLLKAEMERWKCERVGMPAARGRPPDAQTERKGAMLRVKRDLERGRPELLRLFGGDWPRLLVKSNR